MFVCFFMQVILFYFAANKSLQQQVFFVIYCSVISNTIENCTLIVTLYLK